MFRDVTHGHPLIFTTAFGEGSITAFPVSQMKILRVREAVSDLQPVEKAGTRRPVLLTDGWLPATAQSKEAISNGGILSPGAGRQRSPALPVVHCGPKCFKSQKWVWPVPGGSSTTGCLGLQGAGWDPNRYTIASLCCYSCEPTLPCHC